MSEFEEIINVVRAVQAYEESITYFTKDDLWSFNAVFDWKLCDQCLSFAQNLRYRGDELKDKFPYLEIENENKIMVNIHPHCRCFVSRM